MSHCLYHLSHQQQTDSEQFKGRDLVRHELEGMIDTLVISNYHLMAASGGHLNNVAALGLAQSHVQLDPAKDCCVFAYALLYLSSQSLQVQTLTACSTCLPVSGSFQLCKGTI